MELELADGITLVLPPILITIIGIIVIILLVKWSKEVETRRFQFSCIS